MKLVWAAYVLLTLAVAVAFSPRFAGSMAFWGILAAPHALVAGYAVFQLRQQGRLAELLRPRWGDLSLGAFVGVLLLVASWAGRETLARVGTPQQAWLLNIYVQVGDPELIESSVWITALLLLIVACEDLIWRGWALKGTTELVGERRGWMLAALLYGATMVPTLFTLAAPVAGLNPLLLVGALFCGLVWTFMAHVIGRLPPVLISHAIFTYFSIVQFRQPGL